MVLAKRERIVAIITLVAIGALGLSYAFSRVRDAMDQAGKERAKVTKELQEANAVIALATQKTPIWNDWLKNGLKSDSTETTIEVTGAVRAWAEAEGVALSLLKPEERQATKSRMPEITVQVSGTGTQKAVAGLLDRIEKSKIPIKVIEVQLGARKETTDDLNVTIRLSTMYMAAKSSVPALAPTTTTTTSAPSPRTDRTDRTGGRR